MAASGLQSSEGSGGMQLSVCRSCQSCARASRSVSKISRSKSSSRSLPLKLST